MPKSHQTREESNPPGSGLPRPPQAKPGMQAGCRPASSRKERLPPQATHESVRRREDRLPAIRYVIFVACSLPRAAWRSRINDRPEDAQLLDGVDKFVEINRLNHIGVNAKFVAGDQ